MKAVAHDRYGTADVVRIREVPKPVPAEDEMLVRVHAASLNRSDWEALTGTPFYARMNGLRTPRRQILGSDVAGTVESVGSRHAHFRPGDEVFGEMESYSGGFAEYVCSKGAHWALKPPAISWEQAAALPQGGVIALQGIGDRVSPGQRVLINGAGGSGGSFAIQMARSRGAEVTAVDHGAKSDFMRSLGAQHVIDYTREDFATNGREYDLVLDLVATRGLFDSARALAPGGSYLVVGGSMKAFLQILLLGPVLRRMRNRHLRVLVVRRNREDLLRVGALVESGKIVVPIDRVHPLDDAAEALRTLGDGRSHGKIVLRVSPAN